MNVWGRLVGHGPREMPAGAVVDSENRQNRGPRRNPLVALRRLFDRDDLDAGLYTLTLAARVLGGAAVAGLAIRIFLIASGFGG